MNERHTDLRKRAAKAREKEMLRLSKMIPPETKRLRPGDIITSRQSGRKMELISVGPSGLLNLTVAVGDTERKKWDSWSISVSWPASWCWIPGQQMRLF